MSSRQTSQRPNGKCSEVIRVQVSNRLEDLVAMLAQSLPDPHAGPSGDSAQALDAVFNVPWLIMPSRPVERFAELELARLRDVSGHFETFTLETALARLCQGVDPNVVLVQREHILGELLALFEDVDTGPSDATRVDGDLAAREPDVLSPFRTYIRAAGEATEARERRRLQLAEVLAEQFDAWSRNTPERLDRWRAGKPSGESETNLVSAERSLWTRLFAAGGRFDVRGRRAGKRFIAVDQILQILKTPQPSHVRQSSRIEACRPPTQVHVFAFSELAVVWFPIFEHLARLTDLHIYALNPSREFWEDLDTARRARVRATHPGISEVAPTRRRRPRQSVAEGQLTFAGIDVPSESPRTSANADDLPPRPQASAPNDNPLLTLCGQSGRETLRLLGQLVDGDFETRFREPDQTRTGDSRATGSRLHQIQQDVLDARIESRGEARTQRDDDPSILIVGAPDPRREWESIAAEIWRQVRADSSLRFSDIAVMVAGEAASDSPYMTLASSAFEEANQLPFAWVDPALSTFSHLGGAFLMVMDLFCGIFTRRAVLDVITHPNIKGRFPLASSQIWVELCDALAVAHGLDRADFADTYVVQDVFNWDQALRRLALGTLSSGPRSYAESPVQIDAVTDPHAGAAGYVPAEIPDGLRPDADAFCLLVRSLISDGHFARQARMPFSEWVGFAKAVMDAYVIPLSPDDVAARLRILTEIEDLALQVGHGIRMPLHTAVDLLRGALSNLRGPRGSMLGAGVAVGPLRALSTLPFRTVIVAGLSSDRFPASDQRSTFDRIDDEFAARASSPNPRARDRYRFLEAVLSARDSLVLTCVDRDPWTSEPVVPSSVLVDFQDVLEHRYHISARAPARDSKAGQRSCFRQVPLHRDEDATACAAFPEAEAESQARRLGDSLRAARPATGALPTDALLRALEPEARAALRQPLSTIESLGDPPEAGAPANEARRGGPAAQRLVIRIAELVRFLQCPLQGSARFFLRMRDLATGDPEERDREDEPMDSPRNIESRLTTEAFLAAWAETNLPDDEALLLRYDEIFAHQRFSQRSPVGLFRFHTRERHGRLLAAWRDALAANPSISGPPRRIAFGRPAVDRPASQLHPAIRLTVPAPSNHPLSGTAFGEPPTPAGSIEVELHGTTSPFVATPDGLAWLLLGRGTNPDIRHARERIASFVETAACMASESVEAPRFGLHFGFDSEKTKRSPGGIGIAKIKRHPCLARPINAAEARAYLTTLVSDLIGGVEGHLFPGEAVVLPPPKNSDLTVAERVAFVSRDSFYQTKLSTGWGPVPDPYSYPLPDATRMDELRQRRFELLVGATGDGGIAGDRNDRNEPGDANNNEDTL